jgi:hypothetical protein
MVSGPRKVALKTWFAFDTSLSIATGFAPGSSIHTIPHQGKRVLTLEEEGTGHDTRSRILKLLKGRGLTPGQDHEALVRLAKNYKFWHHPRCKLDNIHWVNYLRDYINGEGIDLLVLDAITYMTSGDENKKQDMAPVNDALFSFRQAGATCMYLVHTNKQAQRADADPDLDVRGSSVLLDGYDVHYALRRHADAYVNLMARYRDFEETNYRVYWDFKPEAVVGKLAEVSAESEAGDKVAHLTPQIVPGIEYTVVTLQKSFGVTPKEAANLMNSLLKAQVLVPNGSGAFVRKG